MGRDVRPRSLVPVEGQESVRIVYATTDRRDSGSLLGMLRVGGNDVARADDQAALTRAIDLEPPDLVVVFAAAPEPAVLTWIRAAASAAPGAQVLLVHAELSESFVARALEAGADGDVHLPVHTEALAARLGAVRRRAARNRAEPGRPRVARAPVDGSAGSDDGDFVTRASAARPASRLGHIEQVARSAAWSAATEHLRDATARFFSADTYTLHVPEDRPCDGLGSSVVLLSWQAQLEVRISVNVDSQSAYRLVQRVLPGSTSAETAQTMLDELANLFMGALQGPLTNAGFSFTSGVPEPVPASAVLFPRAPYRFQHAALFDVEGAEIVAHVGMRSRANVRIEPRMVQVGMVLAEDVATLQGTPIAGRGTRLSASLVGRLRRDAVDRAEIEVLSP